jgi:hypothetical protein
MPDVAFACAVLAYDGGESGDFPCWRTRILAGIADDPDLRQQLADLLMLAADGDNPPGVDTTQRMRAKIRQLL